jgi:hypothetical protein
MYAAAFRFPLSSTTNSVRASKVTPAQTITETLPKLTFGIMLYIEHIALLSIGSPAHVCNCDPGNTWTRQRTLLTSSDPIPNQRDFG